MTTQQINDRLSKHGGLDKIKGVSYSDKRTTLLIIFARGIVQELTFNTLEETNYWFDHFTNIVEKNRYTDIIRVN